MVSKKETIEIDCLRDFIHVARLLGITRAADALGKPKSAISKSLTQLEGALGVKLLERSSRRVALTSAGSVLLIRAESLLAELDRVADDLRSEASSPRGLVRLSAPPELGAFLAKTFLPTVVRTYSSLRLAMELDYAFTDVLDPRIDLAFRVGDIHDDRLVARPAGRFTRVLVASPDYLRREPMRDGDDNDDVSELAHRSCLVFSAANTEAQWTLHRSRNNTGRRRPAADEVSEVSVRGCIAVRGFYALLEAARSGVGIARVPDFLARDALRDGTLVRVLPSWRSAPSDVWVVYRFGQDRVARVKAIVDEATRLLPDLFKADTSAS